MTKLTKACRKAVETGKAEKVSDTAIFFTGKADLSRLVSVQRAYAKAFHERWQARVTKEQEAKKHLHDFIITY